MFCQNDQIHNNLHLTVENSIEIGKGYQVIDKWVFFKLLFQILQTDSSGGKNHSIFAFVYISKNVKTLKCCKLKIIIELLCYFLCFIFGKFYV